MSGHKPECYVYKNAAALVGVDRRGMCTCGLEKAQQVRVAYDPEEWATMIGSEGQ